MFGSRRQFLARITVAGAALNNMTSNPLGKPIGLQLYTLGAEMQNDFSGTLAKVAQIGIKEVEIAATYDKTAAEWKAALTHNGLHCRSVHMFDLNQPPERIMRFARELGAKYVVTSLNAPPEKLAKISTANPNWTQLVNAVESMSLADWRKSAAIANQLGEQAAKHGLVYAYHNHNIEFKKFGDTTAFETLLASTDPATVKFELDCGWASAAGYRPVTLIEKYPQRIRMLHIKAFKSASPNLNLVGPNAPKSTELGRGQPDYQPIFAAAAKAQVEQFYIEQEPPFTEMPALEAVKIAYDYLHAIV